MPVGQGLEQRARTRAVEQLLAPRPRPPELVVLAAARRERDERGRLAEKVRAAGTTRYELGSAVDLPNASASIVLLLRQQVPGAGVFLFAPMDGVADSASYPCRAAHFENTTGRLLERGSVAVFDTGGFVGEAVLQPLLPGVTATPPFALERGIAVALSRTDEPLSARLHSLSEENGLSLETTSTCRTVYAVHNGTHEPARVLVRHRCANGRCELREPPPGTEQEPTLAAWAEGTL